MTVSFHQAAVAEMDPVTLYTILQLRVDVFVVEQQAAYAELDGRDIEPTARLYWAEEDGSALATIRVLTAADGVRIGRVATASAARGRGLAADLMRRAIADYGGEAIVLDAQQQLEGWYQGFGFTRSGEVFVEDGIPHIPMTRDTAANAR